MDEHNKRLLKRIFESFELYEDSKISEEELLRNLEGNSTAIEEHNLESRIKDFITKVENAIYIYDAAERRAFIVKEIKDLRRSFQA